MNRREPIEFDRPLYRPKPMDRCRVEVISATPNPQQVMYAAMHQDYSENFVFDEKPQWPDEAGAGELIVKRLLAGERGHYGPLEHPQIVLNCGFFPHSVMQQARTHRVGISFDVQCLAGDTAVTFLHASGALRRIKISELYDLWSNGEAATREREIRGRHGEEPGQYRRDCKRRLRKMRLRVLNEETEVFEISHIKSVMHSGIQPVYRITLADGKTLDCTANHRLLTDAGWQHMGDALGLMTDENHQVLAQTKSCKVLCNGTTLQPEALYTHKAWLEEQIKHGLTAKQIAEQCSCAPNTVHNWAKRHNLQLPSGRHKGLKRMVGEGLYRQRDWLETQLDAGKTAYQMANAASCSVETVKKWVYHHGLQLNLRSPGPDQPWNKDRKGYQLNLSDAELERRRDWGLQHKRAEKSPFWRSGVSKNRELIGAWTRRMAPQVHQKFNYVCQHCGKRGDQLHAHHLVPVYADESLAYEFENLVSVCKPCHELIHHNHFEAQFAQEFQPAVQTEVWQSKPKSQGRKLRAHPVEVVDVEYLGMQDTYDLEVDGPWHNFVANGLVVHNSMRYTGARVVEIADGRRDVEDIFYLRPVGDYRDRQGKRYHYSVAQRQRDLDWCYKAAQGYKADIEAGWSEEHARGKLPFDYRQHFVMSVNVRSFMHFLDLRSKKDAQIEIQKLCDLMWPHFQEWVPAIADWYETTRLGKARLSP